MEIGNIHISNAPHIQIDHNREPRQDDRPDFKSFLPNPDINIITKSKEVDENIVISPEADETKIILTKYRTTLNLLLGFKDAFIEEATMFLGESGRSYVMSLNEDVQKRNDVLARLIPETFKQRVLAWAINYKLFLVIDMLQQDYTIENKQQMRNQYLNTAKQVIAYAFHDSHWSQVIDDVRETVKNSEMEYYEKKLLTIKQKIVRVGDMPNHRDRVNALNILNKYIEEFASNYYTNSFPINEHSMDRLKKLVDYINKEHSLRLELV